MSSFNVGGLVSGLNTNDIINQLMALERRPLQLLQSQADREKARLEAIKSVKTAMTSLQSALGKLLLRSTTEAKIAATDTPASSPTVLTASANADALVGSFRVTVSQLATATAVRSTAAIGQVIDRTATLASAGFRLAPVTTVNGNPATFSLNGVSIAIDGTTTLDDGTANSVIARINAAGAGVTASLVADPDGRANNRVQLVSAPGQTIQLGSGADTSNLLKVLNLSDAVVQGHTAASVAGGAVAAGALSTSLTINGVTTVVNQTDAGFTSAQNAAFLANAINTTANSTVNAIDNGDGTISLQHKTLGSSQVITITAAGAGTGLTAGTTQNGTDRVVSTANLGVVNTTSAITSARLVTSIAGLDAGGNGKFKVNGVEISYKGTESLTTIVNRINASNAGVTAFYDPVQDKLRLAATTTGAQAVALEDVTGNFLAATGVLSASQSLGQNAIFAIDTVNGGQALSSASNTVTGYLPGVTLDLKAVSATPVTVTVSQNTGTTVDAVKDFVTKFNAVADQITSLIRYDAQAKTAGRLNGDTALLGLQRQLKSMLGEAGVGLTGKYRSLADIGLTTGAVGTAVGGDYKLSLDESKLTAALKDNAPAVTALLSGFTATLGAPAGSTNIAAVSGTPTGQFENGTYYVKVLDASHNVEVRFVTGDGRQTLKTTGVLTPGIENSALIGGLKLTANGTLNVGEETSFSLTVNTRGVGVGTNDYLKQSLSSTGFFKNREDSSQAISQGLTRRIEAMEDRLKQREAILLKKFTALETTMARLQQVSSALGAQIAQLSTQTSSQ